MGERGIREEVCFENGIAASLSRFERRPESNHEMGPGPSLHLFQTLLSPLVQWQQPRPRGWKQEAGQTPHGMEFNTISNKKSSNKQNIGEVTNLQENVTVYLHMLAKAKVMCIFKPLRRMRRAASPPPLYVGMGVLQK